ncbi:hypothetical protein U9M48_013831 [Paspalum notatum var. saurae]|uniref:Integrase catalytic domain-containing protein n=1 Tax=Paspalum notatum var. saurae TaxID=547442 RepID=A0AAQ3WK35_PASNO
MASYPGELFHMDTVGPAQEALVSGKWYVLVVVDDFSRFLWIFFMEFKDMAFGFVRDLVLRLRNECHKAMRAIHSDNGGEFRNSRFENFCHDLGKSSYELWFGRRLSVKHLIPFGCRCFVLNKECHMDKFESRCLDGVFLGYASSSRAFRVWIIETRHVVETCEVSFDETMPCTTLTFELSGDEEEGTPPIFEDEDDVNGTGDARATSPVVAPAPSATSFDDEDGPMPTASSSLPQVQAQADGGPAEDAREVTSERVPYARQVQRDHPL